MAVGTLVEISGRDRRVETNRRVGALHPFANRVENLFVARADRFELNRRELRRFRIQQLYGEAVDPFVQFVGGFKEGNRANDVDVTDDVVAVFLRNFEVDSRRARFRLGDLLLSGVTGFCVTKAFVDNVFDLFGNPRRTLVFFQFEPNWTRPRNDRAADDLALFVSDRALLRDQVRVERNVTVDDAKFVPAPNDVRRHILIEFGVANVPALDARRFGTRLEFEGNVEAVADAGARRNDRFEKNDRGVERRDLALRGALFVDVALQVLQNELLIRRRRFVRAGSVEAANERRAFDFRGVHIFRARQVDNEATAVVQNALLLDLERVFRDFSRATGRGERR